MGRIASPMLRSPSLARTARAEPWRGAIEAWRRIPIAPKLVGLAALKLALLVVFLVISNQGVAGRFASFWERGHVPGLVVFSGVWVISLAAVAIAALLPAFWMRLLWSVPIALSTFAGVLALEVTKTHLTFFNVALYWAERAHLGGATESTPPGFSSRAPRPWSASPRSCCRRSFACHLHASWCSRRWLRSP
jgi:hypothetical protein